MRRFAAFLLPLLLFLRPAQGAPPEALPPPADVVKNVETLKTLAPALQTADKELAALRTELKKATTDEARAEINERVEAQRERVRQLRSNFRTVVTGVEENAYLSEAEATASLDTELKGLLKPLINELRSATAKPREMEELQTAQRRWKERLELSQAALGRVEATLPATKDEDVREELDSARKLWSSRRDEARSETETLARQIEERERNNPSAFDALSRMLSTFWRSRGLNLLLALGVAMGVYFLVRRSYRLLRRYSPLHRRRGNGLMARSADLMAAGLAGLLAVAAVVMVFYLRGDWLLLALAIILIIGLLWASKTALPPYIEQIKVILNVGPLRQGERILHEGVAWRVDALNMDCEFSNPELTGGLLRLPVQVAMKLHSRPADPKEPWFPTKIDDWVQLDDGCYGKVIQQTPEQVVVLRLGGSRKTYATTGFLARNPENLSRGFRVMATFGIAYEHLALATEEVPEKLQEKVLAALIGAFGREEVRSVKVEFDRAAASSLDYVVIADFSGEVAPRLRWAERQIQRTCLETCREEGWEIPFPQLVVRRGGGEVVSAE